MKGFLSDKDIMPHVLLLITNLAVVYLLIRQLISYLDYGTLYSSIPAYTVFAYFIYLGTALCSVTAQCLQNVTITEDAITHVNRIKRALPVLWHYIRCYHIETRTENVYKTRYERNNNGSYDNIGYWETQTTQVEVTTFETSEEILYDSCRDTSSEIEKQLNGIQVVRLSFSYRLNYADRTTADYIDKSKHRFLSKYSHYDRLYSYHLWNRIPGFTDRITAYTNLKLKPFWLNRILYYSAAVCLLAYPFEVMFLRASTNLEYEYIKIIKI